MFICFEMIHDRPRTWRTWHTDTAWRHGRAYTWHRAAKWWGW